MRHANDLVLLRRHFLGWVAAMGAALGLVGLSGTRDGAAAPAAPGSTSAVPEPGSTSAAPEPGSPSPAPAPGSGPGPDERWLTGMDGRHRQVFDVSSLKGGAVLNPVRNFLNAYNEAYGVPDAELNAAVVVHGSALPIAFGDEAWERWGFGERHAITDPATGRPARRNIFRPAHSETIGPMDASVEALQHRGVVFLACNNSLERAAGEIARASGEAPEEVRKELIAGLVAGVVVVPAAVVAINRAQEHGLSYVFLG